MELCFEAAASSVLCYTLFDCFVAALRLPFEVFHVLCDALEDAWRVFLVLAMFLVVGCVVSFVMDYRESEARRQRQRAWDDPAERNRRRVMSWALYDCVDPEDSETRATS